MFISGSVLSSGTSDSLRSISAGDIFGEDLIFIPGSLLISGTSESSTLILHCLAAKDSFIVFFGLSPSFFHQEHLQSQDQLIHQNIFWMKPVKPHPIKPSLSTATRPSLKKNARNSPIPATSVAIKPLNRIKAPSPRQLAAKNKREQLHIQQTHCLKGMGRKF